MFILIIPCVHERGWSGKKKEKADKMQTTSWNQINPPLLQRFFFFFYIPRRFYTSITAQWYHRDDKPKTPKEKKNKQQQKKKNSYGFWLTSSGSLIQFQAHFCIYYDLIMLIHHETIIELAPFSWGYTHLRYLYIFRRRIYWSIPHLSDGVLI
jgi:hypothetical protein